MGQVTQGLFVIETGLRFLTRSSLVLGSVPESVSEIIPVKWYGHTGPILHLKYVWVLWNCHLLLPFWKVKLVQCFQPLMPWHTLQSKWKDEAGCHYLDQEWEILKSITEWRVFFKASNCCSWGLSSVHFSAASFQFLYKRLMILLIFLFLQSQCFLFPAVQWISMSPFPLYPF